MFTGIIESQVVLKQKKGRSQGVRLTFSLTKGKTAFRLGESVGVDGVCLTVSDFRGRGFSADLIPETLHSTTLGRMKVGEKANFEKALRVGDALGGHWVTGHADGVGIIRKIEKRGENFRLQIEAPIDIIPRLVKKGSIAVDGISLTLQEIGKYGFAVGIIPQTYRVTTLQRKRVGDPVNLEVDLMAKFVEHFLRDVRPAHLNERQLRKQGF